MQYLLFTTEIEPCQYVAKNFRVIDDINDGGVIFSCDTDTDDLYEEIHKALPKCTFSLFKLQYTRTTRIVQGRVIQTLDARSTQWG